MYSRYVPRSTSAPTLLHNAYSLSFRLSSPDRTLYLFYNTLTTHMLHALSSHISPCHTLSPYHPLSLLVTPHQLITPCHVTFGSGGLRSSSCHERQRSATGCCWRRRGPSKSTINCLNRELKYTGCSHVSRAVLLSCISLFISQWWQCICVLL